MALIRQTSPHILGKNSTGQVMQLVLIALMPTLLVQIYFFGVGPLAQMVWCSVIALTTEAIILLLRHRPPAFYLKDNSALVTGWLIALAIPPTAPWWLPLIGVSFAIGFGKQIYGGIGNNPFNPAMLGYVLLLISFPLEMTSWLTPVGLEQPSAALLDSLDMILMDASVDGWTMATPLDLVRENSSLTLKELWQKQPRLSGVSSVDTFCINLAFLAGGLFMLWRKVITWHAPVAMLAGIGAMALIFWNGVGSQSNGSPLFHLFSGATMMGAFFIVTDPVSGATSKTGRLLFGFGVGIITYLIRAWGGYPDGVAFATLLMNMAAPTIDYWTTPRTYGHTKANRGMGIQK